MLKNGDIIYFKNAARGVSRRDPQYAFKGHGYGVLLGHVPPSAKEPPQSNMLRILGATGFVSFDDVREILGDEAEARLVKGFEDKYFNEVPMPGDSPREDLTPPPADDDRKVIVMPRPQTLLDINGRPVSSDRDGNV